jgi:hypothetical protein
MTRTLRHALASWIALFAILFGALAPTLSHAFVPAAGQAVEFPICSAHAVEVKTPGLPELGADPLKHCPYCVDQHHAPGLLPQAFSPLFAIGGAVLPSLFYAAPTPLFQWAAPQSRAPPRLS